MYYYSAHSFTGLPGQAGMMTGPSGGHLGQRPGQPQPGMGPPAPGGPASASAAVMVRLCELMVLVLLHIISSAIS